MLIAWTKAVRQNLDNPRVLSKAGSFFGLSQPLLSLKLAQKAVLLEPGEVTYRMSVSNAIENVAREALNPESRVRILIEAVNWCEEVLKEYDDPGLRSIFLVDAVSYALRAGDHSRVERFAKELLEQSASEQNWNRGNSLHCAHLALGHLALNNDLEQAKTHLLAAADIEGSPQLKSFGPHFGLARRFLALGELEVVAQYLQLCRGFWFSGQAFLDAWLGELKAGRVPELSGFRGE